MTPPTEPRSTSADDAPLQRWALLHALVVLAALSAAWAAASPTFLLVGGASIAGLVARFRGRWTPGGAFGGANALTALRLAGVLLLTVSGAGLSPILLLALVVAILILDGLDGALARRRGEASAFGEYFDKETDALLLLLLCLLLALAGRLGPWILLAGALRYVFVLAAFLARPQVRKESKSRFGRFVYVLTVSALLLAFLPVPALYVPVAAGATALLVLSFARSFWLLFAAAPPPA